MIRRYVMAATLLGITACATSVPEPPESPEPAARAEELATDSTATGGGLEVVEVPDVSETPMVAKNDNPKELVCRYERETGSHMRTRVCRWQADVEEGRKWAQKSVRAIGMPGVTSMPPDH